MGGAVRYPHGDRPRYLPVSDVGRSRAFYRELLRPLGVEESLSLGDSAGFGLGRPGALWIYPAAGRAGLDQDPCGLATGSLPPFHLAFRAETWEQVNRFFDAARQLDAELVAPPGLFPQYHPTYFAAFVRDPDGHNVEAVCGGG